MVESSSAISKLFPGTMPILLHLRDNRLIGNVRRMKLHQFGCVSEELGSRHRIDLRLRRSCHVN